MLRKLLLLSISFSFLTACAHTPGGVSASNIPLAPNSYTVLGKVSSSDCAYALLGLIPITSGNKSDKALNHALTKVPETDALVQITSDFYSQYWILWSNDCTQIDATAVKFNS